MRYLIFKDSKFKSRIVVDIYMGGNLFLDGSYSSGKNLVPKSYVDSLLTNLPAGNITSTLNTAVLPSFSGDVGNTVGSNSFTLAVRDLTPGGYIKPIVNAQGLVIDNGTLSDSDIDNIDMSKITANLPDSLSGYGITDGITLSGNSSTSGYITSNATPTEDEHLVTKEHVDGAISSVSLLSGSIISKLDPTAEVDWLFLDGSYVNKTTYEDLYEAIGDTYNCNESIGSGAPWNQQYRINDKLLTNNLSMNTLNTFPIAISSHGLIVTKNRVYTLGGYNGSNTISTVYTAPIDSDGVIGNWTSSGNLPDVNRESSVIVTKNRVYVIGGTNGNNATYAVNTIYTAPINSDGTIGSWTSSGTIPTVLLSSSCFTTKNRVYLVGGHTNSTVISTIYTAPINSDGTLGSWTSAGNLPVSLYAHNTFTTDNTVYVIGGFNNLHEYSNNLISAPINSDGTIGSWTVVSSNVPPSLSKAILVSKNRVYISTTTLTGSVAHIYGADIYEDGTLGHFTASGGVHHPGFNSFIATSDYVYSIGGSASGTPHNVISRVAMSGGLNDYSPYYDGTITSNDSDLFRIPNYIACNLKIDRNLHSFIKI